MRIVDAEPLTPASFRDFGSVIEAGDESDAIEINSGTCRKFAEIAYPDCETEGGRPAIHIFRAQPATLPIVLRTFECHRLGTQAFIPLSSHPFLVAVAPPGRFSADEVRVFLADKQRGVQFRRGTWHHFCLALDNVSDFLVIDRVADSEDCSEFRLSAADQFEVRL